MERMDEVELCKRDPLALASLGLSGCGFTDTELRPDEGTSLWNDHRDSKRDLRTEEAVDRSYHPTFFKFSILFGRWCACRLISPDVTELMQLHLLRVHKRLRKCCAELSLTEYNSEIRIWMHRSEFWSN